MTTEQIQFHKHKVLQSTNQNLYHISKRNLHDKIVVWAEEQTQGRGSMGNQWISQAGENITMSLLLRNPAISLAKATLFNFYFCTQIIQTLSNWQIEASIKWPNDIMLDGRKIGGVLIENKIRQTHIDFSVLGLGLNVYQKKFENMPHAASIALFYPNFSVSIDEMVRQLAIDFYEHAHQLHASNARVLLDNYTRKLVNLGIWKSYRYKQQDVQAQLIGVEMDGSACFLLENNEEIKVQHKEIEYAYK